MRYRAWSWLVALVMMLPACGGSDSFTPTEESVAGSYRAGAFTVNSGLGATDLLAAGATVDVALDPEGTTSGRLFIPGGAGDGSDVDVDLTGTWTLSGTTVTFVQDADTFIRDLDFAAGRNTLTGEDTLGGAAVFLQLVKTD